MKTHQFLRVSNLIFPIFFQFAIITKSVPTKIVMTNKTKKTKSKKTRSSSSSLETSKLRLPILQQDEANTKNILRGIMEETKTSENEVDSRIQLDDDLAQLPFPLEAWNRFKNDVGDIDETENFNTWCQNQAKLNNYPTSEFWIISGLYRWHFGMKKSFAAIGATLMHTRLKQVQQDLRDLYKQDDLTDHGMQLGQKRILGAVDDKYDLQLLSGAYSHLSGRLPARYIVTEVGSLDDPFVASPAHLSWVKNPQIVGILFSISRAAGELYSTFGKRAKTSPGVLGACRSLFTFLEQKTCCCPVYGVEASPEGVIKYCRQRLRNGMKWNEGMREFVSLQYRGTVLYSAFCKLLGQSLPFHPDYYESSLYYAQWAREFITLADREWKVSKEASYDEKGAVFQPSFRTGIMVAELETRRMLRDLDETPDKRQFPLHDELKLACEIVSLSKSIDMKSECKTDRQVFETVFGRRPLAFAHAAIAGSLIQLSPGAITKKVAKTLAQLGLRDENDPRNLIAIAVEHYRLAAETELHDGDSAPTLWWAYAGNMVAAGTVRGDKDTTKPGYYLGELRRAIQKANEASRERNFEVFGDCLEKGGTCEMLARLVAKHFQDKDDSFVLPKLEYHVGDNEKVSLCVAGETVCVNFSRYIDREAQSWYR